VRPKLVKVGSLNSESHLQDELDVPQKFWVAKIFPDVHTVLKTIHNSVFRQELVEAVHWSYENNRLDIVKVGVPGFSLSSGHITLVGQ